jgi:hypothetical protein
MRYRRWLRQLLSHRHRWLDAFARRCNIGCMWERLLRLDNCLVWLCHSNRCGWSSDQMLNRRWLRRMLSHRYRWFDVLDRRRGICWV